MVRTIIYIDSRNLHYKLRDRGIQSQCIDYLAFARLLAKGNGSHPDKHIEAIKFYCARYPAELDLAKHHSDDAFFNHIEKNQKVTLRTGHYKFKSGRPETAREKGVDVLLATDLIVDAVFRQYDVAYIVSDDSDILPAIDAAKKINTNLRFIQVTFEPRNEWSQVVNTVFTLYDHVAKKLATSVIPASPVSLQSLSQKFPGVATTKSKPIPRK